MRYLFLLVLAVMIVGCKESKMITCEKANIPNSEYSFRFLDPPVIYKLTIFPKDFDKSKKGDIFALKLKKVDQIYTLDSSKENISTTLSVDFELIKIKDSDEKIPLDKLKAINKLEKQP